MREIQPSGGRDLPTVDICRHCQLFWYDTAEYEVTAALESVLQQRPREPSESKPKPERRTLAELWKDYGWAIYFLPALKLSLPIEISAAKVQRTPWATWATMTVIALFSIIAFGDVPNSARALGLIPSEPLRLAGLTFLTSFFIHGDIFHLIGNLYYLFVFGDNVEDSLGARDTLMLLTLATVVGGLAHAWAAPDPNIPLIGASGGISGLVAFYGLRFPRGRITVFAYRFIPLLLPVWLALVAWLVLQLIGLEMQLLGIAPVSAAAHLGGALVGAGFWVVDRFRRAQVE